MAGEVVAIDGKTLRGSFDTAAEQSPLHLVSAWATEARLVLGQVACAAKSNEITAIPLRLELLDLRGAIVTIDAMGCQTKIAAAIRGREADYVLAVKANQPTLHAAISDAFLAHAKDDDRDPSVRRLATVERGHGWQERRAYCWAAVPAAIRASGQWADAASIGMVLRTRRDRVLPQQPAAEGEGVRQGGARPLGDREPGELGPRCNFCRGRQPGPAGSRPGKPGAAPPPGAVNFAARFVRQGQPQRQASTRRLGRRVPADRPHYISRQLSCDCFARAGGGLSAARNEFHCPFADDGPPSSRPFWITCAGFASTRRPCPSR